MSFCFLKMARAVQRGGRRGSEPDFLLSELVIDLSLPARNLILHPHQRTSTRLDALSARNSASTAK